MQQYKQAKNPQGFSGSIPDLYDNIKEVLRQSERHLE